MNSMSRARVLGALIGCATILCACYKLSDDRRACSGTVFRDVYQNLPVGDTLAHAAKFLTEYVTRHVVPFSIATENGRLLELEALEAPPREPMIVTLSQVVDHTQVYGTDMITLRFTADGSLFRRTCEAVFTGP